MVLVKRATVSKYDESRRSHAWEAPSCSSDSSTQHPQSPHMKIYVLGLRGMSWYVKTVQS